MTDLSDFIRRIHAPLERSAATAQKRARDAELALSEALEREKALKAALSLIANMGVGSSGAKESHIISEIRGFAHAALSTPAPPETRESLEIEPAPGWAKAIDGDETTE